MPLPASALPSSAPEDGSEPSRMTTRAPVVRYRSASREAMHDHLAVEEPLQIRLAGEDVAVTMRTPGHDEELAAGFLFTEGVISSPEQIESIRYCLSDDGLEPNIINVAPADRALLQPRRWGRNFISSSSCGLCGKTSIDQILTATPPVRQIWRTSAELLYALPRRLRGAQDTFERTGGLHAAAIFDRSGSLLLLREDVGRHNAVDKVVGNAFLRGTLPLSEQILVVSSRASFEIVQKALVAGVSMMAVVSAPSSLAVELAREGGMTLVAFLRGRRLNVYAGEERVEV